MANVWRQAPSSRIDGQDLRRRGGGDIGDILAALFFEAPAQGGGVTGALAAAEIGADTAAFAGNVGIAGSFSATETPDTFAGVGTVAIGGALAASEAGGDTFAANGTVRVSGAFSATETGNDAFAGAGAVRVSGSFAPIEVGGDTFAATGSGATTVSIPICDVTVSRHVVRPMGSRPSSRQGAGSRMGFMRR